MVLISSLKSYQVLRQWMKTRYPPRYMIMKFQNTREKESMLKNLLGRIKGQNVKEKEYRSMEFLYRSIGSWKTIEWCHQDTERKWSLTENAITRLSCKEEDRKKTFSDVEAHKKFSLSAPLFKKLLKHMSHETKGSKPRRRKTSRDR